MAKRLSRISLGLFVTWLHRRRVMGGWRKLNEWDQGWPFGERIDPWMAIVYWISKHTGFEGYVVEKYMLDVSRSTPNTIDPYTSRELFKWWEDGAEEKLIRAFWESYPDLAESMPGLPKSKKAKTRRRRGKRSPRTTLTPQQELVKRALECGFRQVDIAKKINRTEGRVSQIVKKIEAAEKAGASRGLPLSETLPLHNDYSKDAPAPKRTPRQRKKRTD